MCDEKKTTKETDVIVQSLTSEIILIGSVAVQQSSDPAQSGGSVTNGHTDGKIPVRVEVVSTDEESEDNKEKKGEVAVLVSSAVEELEKKEKEAHAELTEIEDKEKNEGKAPLESSEVDDEVSFKTSHTVTFASAVETIIEAGSYKAEDVESKMETDEVINKSIDESQKSKSEQSETQTETAELVLESEIESKKPEADAEVHRTEIQIDLSRPEGSKNDFGSVEIVFAHKANSAESEAAAENENNENGELEEAALMHSAVIILGSTDSETTESTEVVVEDQSRKEIEVDKITTVNEESNAQHQTVELKNDEERANKLIEQTEEQIQSEDNVQVEADKALNEVSVSDKSEELITKMTKLLVESANETCSG